MVQESLARRFKSAGFEQPEGSRRNYVKPRDLIQKLFNQWTRELPEREYLGDDQWDILRKDQYQKALELVRPLKEIPYLEANSLLACFKPKRDGDQEAGLFVSACYTQSPENIIVLDGVFDDINSMGFMLPENRVLVNNGKVGDDFGQFSSGVVVNNGSVEYGFCSLSSGIIIQNGRWSGHTSWKASGKIIFTEKPEDVVIQDEVNKLKWSRMTSETSKKDRDEAEVEYMRYLKNLSENQHGVLELKTYVDCVKQMAGNIKDDKTASNFIQKYGPNPRARIEQDIDDILKRWGFKVSYD